MLLDAKTSQLYSSGLLRVSKIKKPFLSFASAAKPLWVLCYMEDFSPYAPPGWQGDVMQGQTPGLPETLKGDDQ